MTSTHFKVKHKVQPLYSQLIQNVFGAARKKVGSQWSKCTQWHNAGQNTCTESKSLIFLINLKRKKKKENVTQLQLKMALNACNCICLEGENERQVQLKQSKRNVTGAGEVSESRPDKMFSQYPRILHFFWLVLNTCRCTYLPLKRQELVCCSRHNEAILSVVIVNTYLLVSLQLLIIHSNY